MCMYLVYVYDIGIDMYMYVSISQSKRMAERYN